MSSFFAPRQGDNEVSLTITARTFFKVVLLIIVTIIILAALRDATHALVLVFIAFFLAIALNAPVSWIARHLPGASRGSRSLATAISYLIVIIALAAFLGSFIPPIVRQTQSFIDNAPQLIASVHDQHSQLGQLVTKYHLQGQLDELSNELSSRLQHSTSTAVSTISRITSSLFATLTILVLTFMMLIEGPAWIKLGRQLIQDEVRREHVDQLVRDMYKAVKGYVNGQVLLAAIASVLILPGLLIFHVSYPIALLAVVFICGLIPMVGHTIGAIIVTAIALFHSPFSALGILIYYILYQQIENYLIQPRLQANATNLSPLLVFMAVVVGVSFDGLLGGLLAIPVVACLRVWIIDYIRSRHLLNEDAIPTLRRKKAKAS
ncbi:MAG TPA: AI-2E family transporter [Candidatus Saccharimonadales bacterium]|nr:AI-2E family transporter [Candidatus Saccharimonadales bacterium]